jgi:hypothetical protein
MLQLDSVHCREVSDGEDVSTDGSASWEGSELQLVRAALKDVAARGDRRACAVLMFADRKTGQCGKGMAEAAFSGAVPDGVPAASLKASAAVLKQEW